MRHQQPQHIYKVKINGDTITLRSKAPLNQEQVIAAGKKIYAQNQPTAPNAPKAHPNVKTQTPEIAQILQKYRMSDTMCERILDMEAQIVEVTDPVVQKFIKQRLNDFVTKNNMSKEALKELEFIASASNEFAGKSSFFRDWSFEGQAGRYSNLAKFNKMLTTDGNSVAGLLQQTSIPNKFQRRGKISLQKDLQQESRLFSMREYLKMFPESEISDHFYSLYLSERNPEMVTALKNINERLGVKVFAPGIVSQKAYHEFMNYLETELSNWQTVSGGKAKLPPVIDLSTAKTDWYGSSPSTGGLGAATAYSESSRNGSLAVSTINVNELSTRKTIRHEMTHTNDTKLGQNIPEKYNLTEILPQKKIIKDGQEIDYPDITNAPYAQEFRNAGVSEQDIEYAHRNTKEFIAVASQGDMSKYSPEFKQVLIDFGMPEWLLKLPN